eukprot:TRINITY_DN8110_c1_g2_i1.p1 TRINITY_DN8110_c1_g2~~TRINITY_DN8110_c1_g2_i1.p1  ORF type:complete len:973 (-),score=258.80 TRINITY_DN8110_c1_g2_i1:173-3091(-)
MNNGWPQNYDPNRPPSGIPPPGQYSGSPIPFPTSSGYTPQYPGTPSNYGSGFPPVQPMAPSTYGSPAPIHHSSGQFPLSLPPSPYPMPSSPYSTPPSQYPPPVISTPQYPPPQNPYPPQSLYSSNHQYPPQPSQYPPPTQYPPQVSQYPPQASQYPPQASQYPPQHPPVNPEFGLPQTSQYPPQQSQPSYQTIQQPPSQYPSNPPAMNPSAYDFSDVRVQLAAQEQSQSLTASSTQPSFSNLASVASSASIPSSASSSSSHPNSSFNLGEWVRSTMSSKAIVKVDEVGQPPSKTSMSEEDLINFLKSGDTLHRVYANATKKKDVKLSKDDPHVLKMGVFKSVPLRYVDSIRKGKKTQIFEKNKSSTVQSANYCFSIVLSSKKTYDFYCANPSQLDVWICALSVAVREAQDNSDRGYVRRVWNQHGGRALSRSGIIDMLFRLNFTTSSSYIEQQISRVDQNGDRKLNFDEFVTLVELLRSRKEFDFLFESYSQLNPQMTAEQFLIFLRDEQKETQYNLEICKLIIAHFEGGQMTLTKKGFSKFMSSNLNLAFDPRNGEIFQDMSHPLTHYYVNSSHNTYLEGDQLTSNSSLECYRRVLQSGCRCVELDCWDGKDGEPDIYHGHTLTSKIKFRDVIETINEYAFVTSPYPVILSLENHCGAEQQLKMANHMKEIFGNSLALGNSGKDPTKFPYLESPTALKGKFLLKGKMLKTFGADEALTIMHDPETAAQLDKTKKDFCTQLSDILFLGTVGIKDFDANLPAKVSWEMISLSEDQTKKFLEKSPAKFAEFNRDQFCRVYPKGTRVDSSNYDPNPGWNAGCQIVALNFQTWGDMMWLNRGKFLNNGNSGYILKPAPLLASENFSWDPKNPKIFGKIRNLTVKILSGRTFPKTSNGTKGEVIDPFVIVRMHGLPGDSRSYQTGMIKNNGFNPEWNETFSFPILYSELATLVFVVKDQDTVRDDTVGYYSGKIIST